MNYLRSNNVTGASSPSPLMVVWRHPQTRKLTKRNWLQNLLFNDWHHIELVDENNNVVPEGVQGALLITPLYRTLQPLIRYRMSDTMVLKTVAQPFISLYKFTGRESDVLFFVDDENAKHQIHPAKLIEFFTPGLKKFQFEQTASDALLLRIVVANGYCYTDTKKLAKKGSTTNDVRGTDLAAGR